MPSMLDAALDYARDGWEVFAIGSKQPYAAKGPFCDDMGRGGFYAATTRPDVLRQQFDLHPDSGIALRPPSGVAVLDIDRPEALGDRKVGATRIAYTRRGFHVYHRWPYDPRPMVSLLPGIDLKSRDSYVRVPPTTGYEWSTWNTDIIDAPDWLLALRPDAGATGNRRDLLKYLGPIVSGIAAEVTEHLTALHDDGREYTQDEVETVVAALLGNDLFKPDPKVVLTP